MTLKPSPDFFEPHQRLEVLRHFEISDVKRILVIGVDVGSQLVG